MLDSRQLYCCPLPCQRSTHFWHFCLTRRTLPLALRLECGALIAIEAGLRLEHRVLYTREIVWYFVSWKCQLLLTFRWMNECWEEIGIASARLHSKLSGSFEALVLVPEVQTFILAWTINPHHYSDKCQKDISGFKGMSNCVQISSISITK